MKKLCLLFVLLATSFCYAQDTISNSFDVDNSRDTRSSVTYDFENGTINPWTVIDADGDGYCWLLASEEISNAYGHNGSSDFVLSASYNNYVGVLYPDNYLISPQVQLGGYISFWACANDNSYAAEHFGVAISTSSNTSASSFTTIQEWTMAAKSEGNPANMNRSGNRTQGTWYQYFVDLSYYAGQTGYIAIRHFNCSDMWYLDVDDITISQLYDFEDGTLQGWTVSSNDNGSTTWAAGQNGYNPSGSSNYVYTTHNGNYYVGSVYDVSNAVDDWLISPRFMLGGSMSFYIKSTNATNYTDYYSVCLSTGTNNINQFTTTLVPSTQVTSTDYTLVSIDLSNYSGQGYVAIRHTSAANQASLLVDDISFSASSYGLPWNLMTTFNAAEAAQYGVATDGQNIYTCDWGYSGSSYDFYKYDMNGNLIEGFNISGCSNIQDLTYDGQYFYGGDGNTNMLYCINLAQKILVSSTNTSVTIRHCSYDPLNDGFWVGGWNDLKLISRSGQVLTNAPNPPDCAGSGYYTAENGTAHLLLNCQGSGTNTIAEVYDYNIATNTISSNPIFDLAITPGYNGGVAGGAFVGEYNGKTAFFGDIQQSPNLIGIYELSDLVITASSHPSYGGTVSGTGTFELGNSCTLHATANSGYSFFSWTENGILVSTDPTYSFTVTHSRNLVANFVPASENKCTLVFDLYDSYGDGWNNSILNVSFNNGLPTQHLTMFSGSSVSYELEVNDGAGITLTWTSGLWVYECSFIIHYEDGTIIYQGSDLDNNFSYNFQMDCPELNYSITATANPSNGGTVSGGGTYHQGQTCTLTAEPVPGYSFLRWTKNGTQVSTNPSYSFTVTESASYVAHFQLINYTISVTASPSNGGTVTGGGSNYHYGDDCTVTANDNTGFNFINWTEDGNPVSIQPTYTFTVTSNRNLVANFTTQSYIINTTSIPYDGGTTTGDGGYNYGDQCTLTATPSDGYTFVNWTKDGTQASTNASYTFTVTESALYEAHFQLQSFTINASADPENGGSVAGGGSFYYGQTCTLTATPTPNYDFINWTKDGNFVSDQPSYSFTVTENANYVAHFSPNNVNYYNITVFPDPDNGGIVDGGGTFAHGVNCTIKAEPFENFEFVNWTKNGVQVTTDPVYSFQVTDDAVFVAHFSQNVNNYVINVSVEPSDGGTFYGEGTYTENSNCTLTAFPNDNYIFEKWTKNENFVSTDNPYIFNVIESATYVAHFKQSSNQCTVTATASPANGGSVLGGGTYEQGDTCTLIASANSGFSFVNWTDMSGTQLSTEPIYSFTVTSNVIYLANFAQSVNTYNITAIAEPYNGGTIAGTGTYEEGALCTLSATPSAGFSFVNWTENGTVVSTEAHFSFTVDHERSFVAVFSQGLFYTITASAGANGSISPEGEVMVTPGEDKTFSMIPNSECQVSKVLVDGVDRGPIPSYTFRNVNESHTIHVEFSGLGVDDNASFDLKVYPNPANEKINIESPNMKRIAVFDMLGVLIESKEVHDEQTTISLKSYSQGTYILKVEYIDESVGYSRFVVVE